MKIRSFEDWANSINTHEANTAPRFLPNGGATGYMADLYVSQLEKDEKEGGNVIRTYHLHHCFPTNVSPIDLAYDSNDQIAEFTVEWQYPSSPQETERPLEQLVLHKVLDLRVT